MVLSGAHNSVMNKIKSSNAPILCHHVLLFCISHRLTPHNILCEPETGRVASLNVSEKLHNLNGVLTWYRSGYLLHDKAYYSKEDYCVQRQVALNGKLLHVLHMTGHKRCSWAIISFMFIFLKL